MQHFGTIQSRARIQPQILTESSFSICSHFTSSFHQNRHLYESDKILTQFSCLYTPHFSPFFLIKIAIFYESDLLFIFIFPHFLQLFFVKIVLIRSWHNSVWSQSSASNFDPIFIFYRLPFYIIFSPKQPFISIRQNFNPIFISIYSPFFTIFLIKIAILYESDKILTRFSFLYSPFF